jgi:hypothetical protein
VGFATEARQEGGARGQDCSGLISEAIPAEPWHWAGSMGEWDEGE